MAEVEVVARLKGYKEECSELVAVGFICSRVLKVYRVDQAIGRGSNNGC